MSSHADRYGPTPRSRGDHAPYPDDMGDDYTAVDSQARPPRGGDGPSGVVPPPPMGDALDGDKLRPALKRDGSRSRLHSDARPQFPDEASYLGARAPDLERKNRPKDRAFRDLRDGYESDEGEAHRNMTGGSGRRPRNDDPRGPPRRPPTDRDMYSADESQLSRRPKRDEPPPYDDRSDRDGRDERGDRRRRRDADYDDDYPPPRRGARPPPDVEYGSDPIPARRRSERAPPPRRRADYYDDYDRDSDYQPRRRRSFDDHRRPPSRRDEDYYSDVAPRRRDKDRYDDYDRPPRRDRSRRRYSDDYDDYDRRDKDRRRDKPPKEMKIGNFDVGPLMEQGQKHWSTLAPILAPIVLKMASQYLSGNDKQRRR